ncbi:POK6 protein, partial [Malurus elegans]|nr:POK6 protein [Malurus elegans]
MWALQPGLPNPAMLPYNWPLLIIDLKDYKLVVIGQNSPLPKQKLAREAHSVFHQKGKGLKREFDISVAEATAIIRACPICSHHNGGQGLGLGVNTRGLGASELWQMD